MTTSRPSIVAIVDEYAKRIGMEKHSGQWYRRGSDVTVVLGLQRSQYGPQYYLNLGWSLPQIDDRAYPRPSEQHVLVRAESILGSGPHLAKILDLEQHVQAREEDLKRILAAELTPFLNESSALQGLRALVKRPEMIRAAMIRGVAQPMLLSV